MEPFVFHLKEGDMVEIEDREDDGEGKEVTVRVLMRIDLPREKLK